MNWLAFLEAVLLAVFIFGAVTATAAFLYLLDANFEGPRVRKARLLAIFASIIAAVCMCVLVGLDEAGSL